MTLVDAGTRTEIIGAVLDRVRAHYVFPEVAMAVSNTIRHHETAGAYDNIVTLAELCETLTAHIRDIARDKHLNVFYSPEPLALRRQHGPSMEKR